MCTLEQPKKKITVYYNLVYNAIIGYDNAILIKATAEMWERRLHHSKVWKGKKWAVQRSDMLQTNQVGIFKPKLIWGETESAPKTECARENVL